MTNQQIDFLVRNKKMGDFFEATVPCLLKWFIADKAVLEGTHSKLPEEYQPIVAKLLKIRSKHVY